MDRLYNVFQDRIGIVPVLPALEYKCTESKLIACATAGENFFFCQAVTVYMRITSAYATVETVIFAVVSEFNQSAYIDVVKMCIRDRRSWRIAWGLWYISKILAI